MYLKIFLPCIVLMIIQLFSFYVYDGFNTHLGLDTKLIVSLSYIFSLFAFILFICLNKRLDCKINFIEKKGDYLFDLFVLIVTIVFINKPSIILYGLGSELGFDYVRDNFFSGENIKNIAFGSTSMSAFILMYIAPLLWFYVILLIGKKDKFRSFLFFYILFSLVLFNLSYAGRFYIYFSIIALYLKSVLEGQNLFLFLKKYLILFSFLIFLALTILSLRTNRENISNEGKDYLVLLEYHIMQPSFFGQKIEDGTLSVIGYPFKLIIESFLFPFFFIMGKSFTEISFGFYSNQFSSATLYSSYTNSSYNSFSTLFAYLYSDFYVFTPFFSFLLIMFFLFYSKIIHSYEKRLKYLLYFSLMMYFSLFQAPIFSPGCLVVLILYPFLSKFSFKK